MSADRDVKATVELCENFLNKTMELNDLPGLVIGLAFGDEEWVGASGVRDVTDRDPLQEGDVFHCASVSKLLTSTAIMQLFEEGVINIEDRLCNVLPDLEIEDERWREIRVWQMLSHTSGIGDVDDYHWEEALTGKTALRDYVYSEEVKQLPLLWAPGEGGFRYSNIAYEMLGHIVAEKSGMSYEDYVKENILVPAGMMDSTMKTYERVGGIEGEACPDITDRIRRLNREVAEIGGERAAAETGGVENEAAETGRPNALWKPMALPHEKLEDRSIAPVKFYPYNRAHGPSSTLTSTASDLLKLGRWHMAGIRCAETGAAYDAGMPLKRDTYGRIITEYATVPNNGEKMGLGWFMRKKDGHTFYGHEGTDDGFRASLWICPELETTIAVISNLSGAPVKKINKQLFAELY